MQVVKVVEVVKVIKIGEGIKVAKVFEVVEVVELKDDVEVEDDVVLVVIAVVGCPLTFGTAFGPDPIGTIFSDVAPNTTGARWACLLSRSNTT